MVKIVAPGVYAGSKKWAMRSRPNVVRQSELWPLAVEGTQAPPFVDGPEKARAQPPIRIADRHLTVGELALG